MALHWYHSGGEATDSSFVTFKVMETYMSDIFHQQRAFMHAMGQTVDRQDDAQTTLYLRLTCEEFCETLCAANPDGAPMIKAMFKALEPLAFVDTNADRVALFDGVLDTLVTTTGIGVSAALPLQAGWDEVYKTNVAKVDPETGYVKRRSDGKVLKPDGWKAPDLKRVLEEGA